MKKIDLIKMALKNLAKRKVRTFLTILSVVIGSSSIIVMISLGIALEENFSKQVKELNSLTNINVYSNNDTITIEQIKEFSKLKNVELVTPIVRTQLNFIADGSKYVGTFNVIGMNPEAIEKFGYKTLEGRNLSYDDRGTFNIVINPLVNYEFDKKGKGEPYPKYSYSEEDLPENAIKLDLLEKKLKITSDSEFGLDKKYIQDNSQNTNSTQTNKSHKTYNVKVVGIVSKAQQYDLNSIIMPLDVLEKIKKDIDKINGNITKKENGYQNVLIKCNDLNNVEDVIKEINDLGNFQAYSDAEYINSTKKMTKTIQLFLGAIGLVSLIISAIGITNTMIMSIYERTKEIGIMKVIGAKVNDIKKLFLLEAILIGLIGGIIGITVSSIISIILNNFSSTFAMILGISSEGSKISSIPFFLVISSLIFSSLVGLISGFLPANRAVKIEALKAIKSE